MRTAVQNEFLQLIRYEIAGTPLPEGFAVSDEAALIEISEKHDLTHLLFDALTCNSVPFKSDLPMQRYYAAIWRCEQMDHELKEISSVFGENGVDYMPLKGSVVRGLYPQRWMRTSADIDILIRPEDIEKAETLLKEKLNYSTESEQTSEHHDSFFSPVNRIHLELHKMLFEKILENKPYYKAFSDIWNIAVPSADGMPHRYALPDDYFYVYHIAHMEKHVSEMGGIAVRGLIDLWLLNGQGKNGPSENCLKLLEENGLLNFEERLRTQTESWMKDLPSENEDLEQYILNGYLYGSEDRSTSIGVQRAGKTAYIKDRIFLPYDSLKTAFPVLKKYPVLTPVFEIVRIVKRLASPERRNKGLKELASVNRLDENSAEQTRLKDLRQYLDIRDGSPHSLFRH